MKRMAITINQDGTTDIDLQEGFAGMSCVEKAKQIELIIGGQEVDQREKPSFYEPDNPVNIGIDIQY